MNVAALSLAFPAGPSVYRIWLTGQGEPQELLHM